MSASQMLLLALFAVAAVAIAVIAHREARRRREALAALANELGAAFSPDRDFRHDEAYRQFSTFTTGSHRFASNTIRGTSDFGRWRASFTMGDYQYTVQQGKHSVTYQLSYLLVHLPTPGVPDLFVRREGVFDKIAGAIGFDDINFESAEFSSRFHVRSPDKRFAYDVIHPRMIEFLMDVEPPPIELSSGVLLVCRGTQRWDVDDFRAHLTWAREFLMRWPEHVAGRLKG